MDQLDEIPTSPETSPETPQEAVKPRFRRKLYVAIGLVAIAIVASASIIVFTQFMPGARGEAAPLGLNYDVGEKMTYELSITIEMAGREVSEEGTLEMEVLSFDGENYTIRQSMISAQQEFSFTVKMNQTGHIIEYFGLPSEFEETFSSLLGVPGVYGSYFTDEKIRVGESWEIPLDLQVAELDLQGTASYKLVEIADITVSAGTYRALKIEGKMSDLQATSSALVHFTSNVNGYIYLENATCRLVKCTLHQSVTVTTEGQTQSMKMTMQMELIEHIK